MSTPLGQKQSVEELKLVVYSRALHPELFEIHHDHQISQRYYDAEIWITGCSHMVGFYAPGDTLTEVMAGMEDELPERGLVASFRCRGEKEHEHHSDTGLHYQMTMRVEAMSEKLYRQTHLDLVRAGEKHGLLVPLPQWRSGDLTPFCYVDYRARADSLDVFAYHAFPDELTIVKTQSIFEIE